MLSRSALPHLERALGQEGPYAAELPYNLNWMLDLSASDRAFLTAHPLVACDIGCRGGAPQELAPFFPHLDYVAFDADEAECERMNAAPHPYHRMRVLPRFIGDRPGKVDFHLFPRPGDSSVFRPAPRFLRYFSVPPFEPERTVPMETSLLDEVLAQEGVEAPDFLKLDTQGSELLILRASPRTLASVLMVEVEVEFTEMYEGQPLAHDVMAFMYGQGFDLVYLNRVFGQKQQVHQGPSRGQVLFGDALFARREDRLEGFSEVRIAKYALLLANYGHRDLARHLVLLHPGITRLLPDLPQLLDSRLPRRRRRWAGFIDKLVLRLLHYRRTNQLGFDSDRSWPTR